MDQNENTPPAIPPVGDPTETAATPPAGPIAAEPGAAAKIELKSIDSPPMAPEMSDMVAAASGPDVPKAEPPERLAAERIEEIKPERPSASAPGPRDVIPFAAPAKERASRRFGTFTLLAASVVLAAAFGATAGVLATTGLTRLAGEPAPAAPTPVAAPPIQQITQATQTALTQLRSEVAALKASVEATNRSAGAQYAKLVERFDRLERAQSAGGKSDAAMPKEAAKEPAKETTGSITVPNAAPPMAPVPAPLTGIVLGWAVRDVYRGVAMLQSRLGGMVEVEPGDVLPGLGRIEAIRRQDGRWVVVTSKGTITSMR
jgi:hypothetical protein